MVKISLNEDNFRDLVAGKEIEVDAFIPHTWQDPSMKMTGDRDTAKIILQDIGYMRMKDILADTVRDDVYKNETEYKHGYDAGLNGANEKNSHYSFFTTPAKNKIWEAGYNAGKRKKLSNG